MVRTRTFLLQLEGLFGNNPMTTRRNEEDALAAVIRLFSAASRMSETALLTKLSDKCIFGLAQNSERHSVFSRAEDMLDTAPPRVECPNGRAARTVASEGCRRTVLLSHLLSKRFDQMLIEWCDTPCPALRSGSCLSPSFLRFFLIGRTPENEARVFWSSGPGGVGQSLMSHLLASAFGGLHWCVDMGEIFNDPRVQLLLPSQPPLENDAILDGAGQRRHRRSLGRLLWFDRSDIKNAVCQLSTHVRVATTRDEVNIKRLVWYPVGNPLCIKVVGYSQDVRGIAGKPQGSVLVRTDADWAGDVKDRRSYSGVAVRVKGEH